MNMPNQTPDVPQMPMPPRPNNPLLERARIPGQTFALPSRGVFYMNGEVDDSVKKGEVLVYPMVTMDEIILKTPDKLLNGTGLDEVFRRCIPQIKKPLELLARDVDFLTICLRKVSYGDEYSFDFTHTCENAKEHGYVIDLNPIISSTKKIDTRKVQKDYTLTLPNSQVVKLIPPRYNQMLRFYQSFSKEGATNEELAIQVMDTTVSLVQSVDGIDDRQMIQEWVQQIPAGFANTIGDRIGEISTWGPDLITKVKCRDCGEDTEVELSLNPMHFFS